MPRDLFGDVSDPSVRVGSRKWYTVPLSLAVHTVVLLLAIVVPLVATGALPDPRTALTYVPVVPPMPAPPPVRRAPPPDRPIADPHAAPIVTPSSITKEPDIPPGFETVGTPDGIGLIDGLDTVIAPPPPPPPPPPPAPQKPVPVGGNIRPPERTEYVAPVYPPIAQAARVQGIVIVEATIGIDGRVMNARLLRSIPLLDEAAIAAVRQWTYKPTLLNGIPVPVIMTVTVNFQLQ
jgi:periplasmic protein TonB